MTGWLNYYAISHTYTQVVELAEWVRRRCGCTTGNSGNGRDRADADFSRLVYRARRSTWRREAAKGIGGWLVTASSNVP